MGLDKQLLDILVCAKDKQPLVYFEDDAILYNPRLQLKYTVEPGYPNMLVDEAETVGDSEHEELIARSDSFGVTTGGVQR